MTSAFPHFGFRIVRLAARSLSAAALLLFFAAGLALHATTGPAAPLPEIARLKPLYPETSLARGQAASALVLWGEGDELAALGRQCAAELSTRTGAKIEARPADEVVSRWWEIDFAAIAGRNVIAIGNINNHRLLAALWGEGYVAEDSMFPGAGGCVVRTVHDPFAKRFNVVELAGSDLAGTRRALEVFLAKHVVVRDGATVVPGPVVEIVRGAAPPPFVVRAGVKPPLALAAREKIRSAAEFAADLDKRVAQERSRTDNPAELGRRTLVNVTGALAELAQAWFKTGDAGLPPLMKRLVDEHRDLLQIAPRRVEMEGASADHVIWWNLVEALPVWTDQDRLDVTNALLRDARQGFEHQRPYDLVKEGYTQVVVENHGTFSAMHLLDSWRYFEKYYDLPDTDYWMGVVRATFAGQLASHQILEDSASYLIGCPMHNVMYCFKTRDMRYFQLGIARHHLDYMLQAAHNNLGLMSGFGDDRILQPWNYSVFARIAWFLRDARAQWWIRDFLPNDCGIDPYETATPWDIDRPVTPPDDWDGVKVFPLYKQTLGFARESKTFVTSPSESVGPEWFNKIVFRDGVGTNRQFLLLDGASVYRSTPRMENFPPGPVGHNHRDINTIINFTDRGRMWLVDHTYEQREIADHSGLLITRDGLLNYVPHQDRLRDVAQSRRLGIVRTLYEDYSGADWERAIFWLRGDYFVVLDRVIARQAGDFAVRSSLRGLGEDRMDGSGLWLEQQGKWARFLTDDGAQIEVTPVPFTQPGLWKPYPFARPVVKNLLQFKSAHLAPGEALSFASVVAAGDTREELAGLQLQTVAQTGARVGAGPSSAAYGVGVPAGVNAEWGAYALAGRDMLLAGVSRLGPKETAVLLVQPAVALAFDGERVWVDAPEPARLELPQENGAPRRQIPAGRHELAADSVRAFLAKLAETVGRAQPVEAGNGSSPAGSGWRLLASDSRRIGPDATRLLIADLDRDGREEWLVAGAHGLTVQTPTGEKIWSFATLAPCHALAAGDLDGDGRLEIALGCDDEHLYLLAAGGHERWKFKLKASARTKPPAVEEVRIMDVDHDGTPEILVTGNWIHCLAADGKVKWEHYQRYARGLTEGDVDALAVGDFDGSGRNEIFVTHLSNYPVVFGYDAQGRKNFPADPSRSSHRGIVVGPPQDMMLADLRGAGVRRELIVATTRDLSIRRTDAAHEWMPDCSEPGNFDHLAQWSPPGRPATVFAATDMGAVFAFGMAAGEKAGEGAIGRRWVRVLSSRIRTLAVLPSATADATLWAGMVDGTIIELDPATGTPLAATRPTGSAVVQILARPGIVCALHADGMLESIPITSR